MVVAGCNGSGKSSFSKLLVPFQFQPFDYDIHYLNYYRFLFDSDIRDIMAHNMAFAELERDIAYSLAHKGNFCYETNFNSTPLYWPEIFKNHGYKLHLIYLCMESLAEAKRRVAIRVNNGGHHVPDAEIENRYYEGFKNFNAHHRYFDIIDIFDTSRYAKEPQYLLSIENGTITAQAQIPPYLLKLCPSLNDLDKTQFPF